MAGQKFFAHGTTVTIASDPIGGITNISLTSVEREEVETTDADSAFKREFVPGMSDDGSIELEGRFIVDDAGQLALNANRGLPDSVEIVITLPVQANDDSEVTVITVDAFVKTFDITLPQVEGEAAGFTAVLKMAAEYTMVTT